MEHLILRCKHCHKEYVYCTYGNEDGCSRDYCSECQKAIDEALKAIPVKYEAGYTEIHDDKIFDVLASTKRNYLESLIGTDYHISYHFAVPFSQYDNVELYEHDRRRYLVEWNDETPDDKHVYLYSEFDLINKTFTGKPWTDGINCRDYYSKHRPAHAKDISVQGMTPPIGKISFMMPVTQNANS